MLRNGWTYRVMKRAIHGVTQYEWHDVVMVKYGANGEVEGWTENAAGAGGSTIEDVQTDLALMADAFNQPVIDEWILIARRKNKI
jgi:hypothetical protein